MVRESKADTGSCADQGRLKQTLGHIYSTLRIYAQEITSSGQKSHAHDVAEGGPVIAWLTPDSSRQVCFAPLKLDYKAKVDARAGREWTREGKSRHWFTNSTLIQIGCSMLFMRKYRRSLK